MANTKSACKRIEIAERNRLRNKAYKSTVKTLLKKTLLSINNLTIENVISVKNLISLSHSKIDKAIQKFGGLKEIVLLGSGSKAGFSFGFPLCCLYYKKGFKGKIKLTRLYET